MTAGSSAIIRADSKNKTASVQRARLRCMTLPLTNFLAQKPLHDVAEHLVHSVLSLYGITMITAFYPLGRHVASTGQHFCLHDIKTDHRVRFVGGTMGEIDFRLAAFQLIDHRIFEKRGPSAVRMPHPKIINA